MSSAFSNPGNKTADHRAQHLQAATHPDKGTRARSPASARGADPVRPGPDRVSPLRPGDTRFAVVYRLPYRGEAIIEPKLRNPMERFVVMLPKSMKFEPTSSGIFQPMPNVSPDNVQGTARVTQGQVLSFRSSGTGALVELQGSRQAEARETPKKENPGGGLGVPIDAPDPLHGERGKFSLDSSRCWESGQRGR